MLISGEVAGVGPNEMQKTVGDVRSSNARVEFLKKSGHLADEALA